MLYAVLRPRPLLALYLGAFPLHLRDPAVQAFARASTMEIHPVSSLCVMLLMAAAFGLAGALIAPPVTAFLKVYYEELTLARQPQERTAAGTQGILPRRRCPCPFLPHGNALRCGAGRPHPRLRQPGAHGSYNGATGSSRHGMGLPSRIYNSSLRMWTLKL